MSRPIKLATTALQTNILSSLVNSPWSASSRQIVQATTAAIAAGIIVLRIIFNGLKTSYVYRPFTNTNSRYHGMVDVTSSSTDQVVYHSAITFSFSWIFLSFELCLSLSPLPSPRPEEYYCLVCGPPFPLHSLTSLLYSKLRPLPL